MNGSWVDGAAQIDDCKYIHVQLIEPIAPWGVRVIVYEALPHLYPENPERDFVPEMAAKIRSVMKEQQIPRSFEVIFRNCISYTVLNETYGKYPQAPEVFCGRYFRMFESSHLLELTRKTTYVSDDYPGPGRLQHYQIAGLDDVVDVITTVEPTISFLPNNVAAK